MDAFEDGKFPLGTDCSLGSNSMHKAYCVNGKCVKFNDNNMPIEESELWKHTKKGTGHYYDINRFSLSRNR